MAQKVQFTETVLRDANQSLMATRLPYADYEGILSTMDKAGYYSVECCCGLFLTKINLRNGVARLQIFAHFPPRI